VENKRKYQKDFEVFFRYLSTYTRGTFAGAFDKQLLTPIPPQIPYAPDISSTTHSIKNFHIYFCLFLSSKSC
jgi:hypothetical protein